MFLLFEFLVDPSFMLKSYWWVVVAYRILGSAPVPFGFRSYWDLVGVGQGGLWIKGLGTGLDNMIVFDPGITGKVKYLLGNPVCICVDKAL